MSPFNVGVYQGWNAEALHQLARLLNTAKNEVPCYTPQAEVAESRETGSQPRDRLQMKSQRTAETESDSNQFGYEKNETTKYDTNELKVF